MNTLFRSTIAVAVLVSARAAHADCVIRGPRPDEAMLLTMGMGQEFSFVASGCVELRFFVVQDTTLTKIPKAAPDGSSKEATYKVVLTEREWNMVADGRDELTWWIIGTDSGGDTTRMTQTNAIDHDLHVELSVSEADAKITGEAPTDEAGASVSGASVMGSGDVNGDGTDDVLIGAPGKWGSAGASYLVLGPVPETLDLSDAAARFAGGDLGDESGKSISVVGDVDDDGYDDLLIGAPGDDDQGEDAGAAYLMYGPVTGEVDLDSDADVKFLAEETEEADHQTGFSVSGTGNVNEDDDEYDDLLIGSFWHTESEPRTGAAYLVLGPVTGPTFELSKADAKLLGPTREGDFGLGVNVARAGDVDGDGWDDLAVGTDWNDEFEGPAGVSFALSDPLSNPPSMEMGGKAAEGLVQFVPESEADSASAISGAGDVNADGYGDLLIGASDNLSGRLRAGKAYLILGPLTGTESNRMHLAEAPAQFVGESPGDLAGDHVASAGDVNGDGNADILIGACGNNDRAGAAYLVLGPISGTRGLSRADVKLAGEEAHDCAGFGVSSAGDVDGDGLSDVLVGALHGADGAGAAYVFGGAALSLLTAGSP